MSLRDDLEEVKEETKNVIENHSIAWELVKDFKRENQIIKALLILSIIVNVIIVLLLK